MDVPILPPVPVALCLGGMDPSGGAGLLRDAATLQSLGVHAMAVSLAETQQNGLGCLRILPPAIDPLEQLETLSVHLAAPWGAKIGLSALDLPSFHRLAEALAALAPPVRIWDPILGPTLGPAHHATEDLLRMAKVLLVHGGWVVAPNLPEAAAASGRSTDAPPEALAEPFLHAGAEAVWLKGGHRGLPDVEDHWIDGGGSRSLGRWARMGGSRRGTGCTVAAAWLAYRLRGLEGPEAARAAATWIRGRWNPPCIPGEAGRPMFAPGAQPC